MDDDLEYRIGKLVLGPGDFLVVKSDRRLTTEQLVRMRDSMKSALGAMENKVLVVDVGIDLTVLTKAQIETLAE